MATDVTEMLENRIKIVSDYVARIKPPDNCLDVSECVELAKLLNVNTGSRLRSLLKDVENKGGPKLVMPYQDACKAMRGERVPNTRAVPRHVSTSKVLQKLDFEPPLPIRNTRSRRNQWTCVKRKKMALWAIACFTKAAK